VIDFLRRFSTLIGMAVVAGLVHIAVVLSLPHLAPTDAVARLQRFEVGPGFQRITPASAAEMPWRFADPHIVQAFCRFDLEEDGPIRIHGRAALPYWGLSVHNRLGQAVYAINNRAIGDRPLQMRVMTPEDITRFRADLPDDAEQELLIPAPGVQGFVLLRALVPEASSRALVEREIANLRCDVIE